MDPGTSPGRFVCGVADQFRGVYKPHQCGQDAQSKMADYIFSVGVDSLINAFGAAPHAAVRETAGTN